MTKGYDSLRLINLLFKFGHLAEIRTLLREGLTKIRLENWLLVIQQLLARIDTAHEAVAGLIVDLLVAVGQRHPQALVCPLVLAFKSGGSDRRRYNANRILYSMEEHSPRLTSEAFLVNRLHIISKIILLLIHTLFYYLTSPSIYVTLEPEAGIFGCSLSLFRI
ncbi:unnamed protein product [Protopolystoma xenopodis]|uniref:FAT domain-containing protein n=1 Tax=Protopolystoma xenopodis TaxID=117903 RepID=A0A3S5FEB1_9PLAT|nr:unnamed protein product [Protopolystoma xenopodis]